MDNLLTVALEARHAERNHHRRYEITVGRDLFDHWTVAIRYGRIGQGGRVERFAGADAITRFSGRLPFRLVSLSFCLS
jgi:predicted DNA-binding WGR domain protein